MLVQPQEYEGPSGLTYRSCSFEKAFDVYHMETSINDTEIPSGVQLVSIPHIQEPPIKTHAMICGWSNISAKIWYDGINPDLELLYDSYHQLALSALINKSKYFFHLNQNFFDHSTGTLCLWAPIPLNEKKLRGILQASKTSASWLGIKTLTTMAIERYISALENGGFTIKSKGEPFLTKNINQ